MMGLSFGNMTMELIIFNLQRQPSGFDDMEFSTTNLVEDFMVEDEFDDMFAAEDECFLTDNEPKFDVFEFDDLCCVTDYLVAYF